MCSTCGCSAAEEIDPVESVVVPAPLGRGVTQYYSEGESATYAPSEEAEGSTPATEPTNANFSAESKSIFGKDKNGRMYARRRNGRIITHNAESEVQDHRVFYTVIDRNTGEEIDEGQMVVSASSMEEALNEALTMLEEGGLEDEEYEVYPNGMRMMAESKAVFTKGKGGKMYARTRDGRIITHNAEWKPMPECDECGAVEGGRLDGCDSCGITYWFNGKVYHPRSMRYIGAETNGATCSSCNKVISEDDIIGDGTNRGLCCVPDYYDAESKAVFTKGKGGKMYARTRDGRIITHNAEFMPEGDGNVVGQQTFAYNGTPLHAEEDISFGMVGEGNDFGQMRAEDYDADFTLEKPFQTGAKLSAGLLFGATLFGVAGAGFTALLGSMMDRGE